MKKVKVNKSAITLKHSILVTGGAGFIGSNLCEYFLNKGYLVTCLDNFSTGHRSNITPFFLNPNFKLIKGDIHKLEDCKKAMRGTDYVLHQAVLNSVPRFINDSATTNNVDVSGFLNMLVAVRDSKVKRFVYAASSATYDDLETLPKIEEILGKSLSTFAINKYVNELSAEIFSKRYGIETIGLRYFNVFGRRQDPKSAYAAVIPLFVKKLMNHESPVINGDGTNSIDFTYIDDVIQMNERAILTENPLAINTVYNTACGEQTTLNDLLNTIKKCLSAFDPKISTVQTVYEPTRESDIPHSLINVDKAKNLLQYNPQFSMQQGLQQAADWYWEKLKN
ncbi:MAG: NAD-dependent epimerase/dehydratase family protein [Flavobacterium sp.]|nr:NAD-dependent epimerase/dehydratase family protein [Flavobacterium sp.]